MHIDAVEYVNVLPNAEVVAVFEISPYMLSFSQEDLSSAIYDKINAFKGKSELGGLFRRLVLISQASIGYLSMHLAWDSSCVALVNLRCGAGKCLEKGKLFEWYKFQNTYNRQESDANEIVHRY